MVTDSGEGLLRMTTVKKATLENFNANKNSRKLTDGNYFVDMFTLQASAFLPTSEDALWKRKRGRDVEQIDMKLDFDVDNQGFQFSLLEDVSANLDNLFASSTCLTSQPTDILNEVVVEEDTMKVSYDSLVGMKISGPAEVSGSLKQQDSESR